MDTNKKLSVLYSTLDILKEVEGYNKRTKERSNKAVYPLFLRTNKCYGDADKKLMIFGQETNGWGGIYGSGVTVDDVMNEYETFFNTKYCYTYAGQFWNGVKYFVNKLRKKYPNNSIDYVWNNIVKMGFDKKGFPYNIYDKIIKPNLNDIIKKEIKILKPHVIIFFTGPNYDHIINDIFNEPQRKSIKGFTERELCEIIIPDIERAYRTYHPNYLYRNNIDRYFKKIIKEI